MSDSLRGGAMMQPVVVYRSLREKQRQEREELILQAAEEVLMEKGYYDTSMDEIALRVGVAKGTVYLHFQSKEDLVEAIFQRDMQKVMAHVDTIIASTAMPRAKLEGIFQFMYGGFFSKRIRLLYSIYNSAELRRQFGEKKACMRDLWEGLPARISALLEEGKAVGEFDITIPTVVMLSAFLSLLSPKSFERLMVEGQMSPDELVKHLGHLYFKGIAAI
jgi:TetR/AcrR family transcriptional regulator, fatty acid metabolism regulator protein